MKSEVSGAQSTKLAPGSPSNALPKRLQVIVDQFDPDRAQRDVQALCSDAFAGRRVGTAGHDEAQAWLARRFSALGLETTILPFTLDVPVLDLYGLPTLATLDTSGKQQRTFRHRTEFTPHPRSADTPTRVTGSTRRLEPEGVAASEMWLILDAIPQGEALATFAAECAAKGVIGLLVPQLPNAEGYLVKRIVGQRPVALPVLSVRADLLPTLDGRRVVASAPIRPTHPLGGYVLGVLPGSDPTFATAPLIVSAHYDGVGDDGPTGEGGDRLPCATDNAAGVAVILELARLLASSPQRPQRSIIFAALDAEEINAVGSRVYATALQAQGLTPVVVNLDGAAQLHEVIQIESGPGAAALLVALDQAGEYLEMPLAVGQLSSDNRRFAEAGFPAVGVSIGLSGLHTPADMVDRVEPEAMRRAGTLLLATGWQIAYRG